ncbi:hypothetical protein [uncultured Tateyamaria sp.]|nr:hypothetical protein [uncultured Tateyamaria sp.]
MARLTKLSRDLAGLMTSMAREAQAVTTGKRKNANKLTIQVRKLYNEMFDQIFVFETVIPSMEQDFTKAMSFFQRAALIVRSVESQSANQLDESISQLAAMRQSFEGARDAALSTAGLIETIDLITPDLNGAKTLYCAALRDISEYLDRAVRTMTEVEGAVSFA